MFSRVDISMQYHRYRESQYLYWFSCYSSDLPFGPPKLELIVGEGFSG